MRNETTLPTRDADVWGPEHDQPLDLELTTLGTLTAYVAAFDVLTPAELLAYANSEPDHRVRVSFADGRDRLSPLMRADDAARDARSLAPYVEGEPITVTVEAVAS